MSLQSFNDIVPPDRRSIRNIAPSHARARGVKPYAGESNAEEENSSRLSRKRQIRGRVRILLTMTILLLVAIVGFSFLFMGSRIVILPKQKDVAVEGVFKAELEARTAGTLSYRIVTYNKSLSKSLPASGQEHVEELATGVIVIYNNYSGAEQRLVKNTRFETAQGLIYRIADSVTVPGQITVGGEKVPGSVEVTVHADKPGEAYNLEPTDFKIPGFKGDPRYDAFYARSKTSLAGGFSGNRPSVDDAVLETATKELRSDITAAIREKALAERPLGFHLSENMMFLSFDPVTFTGKDKLVEITQNATLHAVLFSESGLAAFIATQTVAGYDEEPVELKDVSTLILELNATEGNVWEAQTLPVSINGTAHLIWTFDEEQLKKDLAGRDKTALETILTGYPSIEEAEVILRPFWKQSFPEDPSDIAIIRRSKD